MGVIGELYAARRSCPDYAARVVEMIEEQQKQLGRCMASGVGEQLKDMCIQDRRIAALVEKDMESTGMGIAEAEKKIAAFAKKNQGFATAQEVEHILREFYGLGEADTEQTSHNEPDVLSLTDFL